MFPAGNGRNQDDTCGSDGYVNSIYTIAIAGVDYDGTTTYYSERCAAVMATVYAGNRKNKLPYNMVRRVEFVHINLGNCVIPLQMCYFLGYHRSSQQMFNVIYWNICSSASSFWNNYTFNWSQVRIKFVGLPLIIMKYSLSSFITSNHYNKVHRVFSNSFSGQHWQSWGKLFVNSTSIKID